MTPDELLQQYVEKYLRWIDSIEREITRNAQRVEYDITNYATPIFKQQLVALQQQHEALVDKLDLIYELQREMRKL